MKALDIIAKILSRIFSPLLMPTYGIIISFTATYMALSSIPTGIKILVSAIVFALTALLPALVIFVLWRTKKIQDAGLNDRRERILPLAASVLCYIAALVYLFSIHSPWWIWGFMSAATAAVIVTAIVSTKWKISGHATGMGGLTAFVFMLYSNHFMVYHSPALLFATILAAGAVCTSRLILGKHTLSQVAAGFANGALWIVLFEMAI